MKIVFQGDSITDAARIRENDYHLRLGQGYPILTAARLMADNPGRYEIENYAVSGDRVVDVYARIKYQGWNQQPDVLSFLVGINDVWHELMDGNGVDAERFETVYEMLVRDSLRKVPGVKVICMEPFVLRADKGSPTDTDWAYFSKELPLRQAAVRRVAEKYVGKGVYFLPLQPVLDEAVKKQPASYWLIDGVHPTPAGHQLIADSWLRLFHEKIDPESR